MITELDRQEPTRDRPRVWLLPAVTVGCVAAFLALGAFAARESPKSALPQVAPSPAAIQAGAWQATRDLAPLAPVVAVPPSWQVREAELERQSRTFALALPAAAYRSVMRVTSSVTTGLFPADEEALVQLRYRLTDDRTVVLVRLPPADPLRGVEPSRYTADSVVIRGTDARLLSGRSAVEPTILLWTEGTRAYQLYSSTHSPAELIGIAEQLR